MAKNLPVNLLRIPLALALGLSYLALTFLVFTYPLTPLWATTSTVVISEVAWMGTDASHYDEWIELFNPTDQTIPLQGWSLRSDDGSPHISLEGTLGPGEFYLLERTDDNCVIDVPADQIYTGNLLLSGERLSLLSAQGVVVDTANGDGGPWPAGSNNPDHTMERVNVHELDVDANWATNDGVVVNGHDSAGNPLNGTPKAPNSTWTTPLTPTPTPTTTPPPPLPNLEVRKVGPLTATHGTLLTYTLFLSNTGGGAATQVVITDRLPVSTSFVSQNGEGPFTTTGRTLVWRRDSLLPGERVTISLTARAGEIVPGPLVNVATASTVEEVHLADNVTAWTATVGSPRVLIEGVLYDGYASGDLDEAVRVINTGDLTAELAGWELCKLTTELRCVPLPPTLTLSPGEGAWLTRDAVSFSASFGHPPRHALSSWLTYGLSNQGDEVVLRDDTGRVVDVLVYDEGDEEITGWEGPPLLPYALGRREGQILARALDEGSRLPLTDTDTAADWIQQVEDPWLGRGLRYPGWDTRPFFHPLAVTETASLVVGVAPDNAYQVISHTLMRARRTISVEVYTLRHPALITALLRKAAEGVNVTLFLEGTPVGISEENEEWQQQLWACRELEARGGRCYFAVHDPDKRVFARYTLIHAKFLVVDDEWAVVSTQNLTQGALPADDRANGTYGSRGVVLATDAPSVVDRLAALFARDCDPANHVDVRRWDTGDDPRYGPPHPDFVPDLRIRDGVTYTVRFTHPLAVSGSMGLELLTAPEAALRRSDALLGLLARAGQGDRVYVEQLYEQESWGDGPNLRLEAYLDAARRGASVRLLLNRGTFDEPYLDRTYTRTLRYVEEVARTEHLDLRAAAGDPTAYGIHNKMVLVWSAGEGAYAHVGSINGSEHSSKLNREVALQVRSPEVVDYLTRVFLTDWHLSNPVRFPFVAVSYKAPDHLLISEVAYGSGTPRDEWVEIYNPTRAPVDLSGFKVGDAEDAARYEGLFAFPPGTVIPPREVLVVAYDASRAREADFELHDYDPQVPDMLKDPLWGTGDWTLRNDGDQVMLLTPGNQPVDVVVWGDAGYPGVVPHPGAPVLTHSLQRHPPEVDSDDCNADFRAFPPSPGELLW